MENIPQDPSNNAATLMSLPMELQLRIQRELLRDPDTTFMEFKSFRLVCKTFDALWSPFVFPHLLLFPRSKAMDGDIVDDLRRITNPGSGRSEFVKTITLTNWECFNSNMESFFNTFRPKHWYWKVLLTICYLFVLIPIFAVLYAIKPQKIIPSFALSLSRIKAKRYVTRLARNIKLPSVHCARWVMISPAAYTSKRYRLHFNSSDGNWAVYRSTRFLLSLPQLTEVELYLTWAVDMPYTSACLSELRTLNKLSIHVVPQISRIHISDQPLTLFRTIIAHNPNLSHLNFSWISDYRTTLDLYEVLRDVPTDRPLALEHVSVVGRCTNLEALVPHIVSLRSFSYSNASTGHTNSWCSVFSNANVFPAIIKVDVLDSELIAYLKRHPGVVSLWIRTSGQGVTLYGTLSQLIAQHAEKLEYLAFSRYAWTTMLLTTQGQLDLLKCSSLREVMFIVKDSAPFQWTLHHHTLSTFALLNQPINVVIKHTKVKMFKDCVTYCRSSENPLVRDLAGRMLYEKGDFS